VDYIPVIVSEKVLNNMPPVPVNTRIEVEGSFRSHKIIYETERFSKYFILAEIFRITDKQEDENYYEAEGFICRLPYCKIKASGKRVCESMIAVNRLRKTYYLPIVTWERNAAFLGTLVVGSKVSIVGRIQSRDYTRLVNGTSMTCTAYEVAVGKIDVCKDCAGGMNSEYGEGKSGDFLQ
jgi:hypothetical protein